MSDSAAENEALERANLFHTPLTVQSTARGEWRYLDLSGERLGVRLEELAPGETSSVHHYHTNEEEHVILLQGSATLHLGDASHALAAGDHVRFAAGEPTAHHLRNTGDQPCRVLVFGERRRDDVVFYPDEAVMLVKAGGDWTTYHYQPRGQTPATDGDAG